MVLAEITMKRWCGTPQKTKGDKIMKLDKDMFYWSLPFLFWLFQQAYNLQQSGFEMKGRGINHNETLVRNSE